MRGVPVKSDPAGAYLQERVPLARRLHNGRGDRKGKKKSACRAKRWGKGGIICRGGSKEIANDSLGGDHE